MIGVASTRVRTAASALRRSCQRVITMAAQVRTASATTRPVVSARRRITSRTTWMMRATIGPTLAAISAATMMSATAAMPAPWPPESLQHGGLHMTDRPGIGSVKHATHLFSFGYGWVCVAGRAGGWQSSRPGTKGLERGVGGGVEQAHGRLVDIGGRQRGALIGLAQQATEFVGVQRFAGLVVVEPPVPGLLMDL